MAATARAPDRRPPDQPRAIRRVVAFHQPTDQTGRPLGQPEPVTVADRIVADVRTGCYLETAAAHAGVNKDTLHRWLRDGTRAAMAFHAGKRTWRQLTAYERECMALSDRVDEALAESELHDVAQLAQLSRGGRKIRTETTKTRQVDGENGPATVVEVTEKIEELAPSVPALTWRLERRFGDRWGRRQQLEVSGELDLGERVADSPRDMLVAALVQIAERKAAAIDVVSIEAPAVPAEDQP